MKYNYKLDSHVPGVTVKLTRNPLNARVEMTDSAKREFALIAWMQHLVENYFLTSRFYLKPKCGTSKDGVYTPFETRPDEAVKWLERGEEIWYEGWYGEKDGKEEATPLPRVDRIMQDDLVQTLLEDLNFEHSGDCTAFACSCSRCYAEDMLGINTLPVGKSIGYRMKGLYTHYYGTDEQKAYQDSKNAEWKEKYGHNIFWTPSFDNGDAVARDFFDEHQKLASYYELLDKPKTCSCGSYQREKCQEASCCVDLSEMKKELGI
jgi:hypothetical protein